MTYKIQTTKTWQDTMDDLYNEFDLWPGAEDWHARREPGARAGRVLTEDQRRVTLQWYKNGHEVSVSLDTQETPAKNLRALFLCVHDMRSLELRGVDQVVASAYLQIAAPAAELDPWKVLGIRSDAPPEVIKAAGRARLKQHHPDTGDGDTDALATVEAAIEAVT